ncbi:MAG: hypothetical protein F7C34_03175 [Desulfurococcales archaeon]|nr:hypothetical protein [Desulfurococcales archaeon]
MASGTLVACVTLDPASLESLRSGLARISEYLEPKNIVLLLGRSVPDSVLDRAVERAKSIWRNVDVKKERVGERALRPGALQEAPSKERIVSTLKEACADPPVTVYISSCSRRQASLVSLAAASVDCPLRIVHGDFYFGPWKGLTYPETPRIVEPLTVLHGPPLRIEVEDPTIGIRRLQDPLGGGRCPRPALLRCAVARLTYLVNTLSLAPGGCRRLRVKLPESVSEIVWNPCSPEDYMKLASRIEMWLTNKSAEHRRLNVWEILAWSGLYGLRPERGQDDPSKLLLVDTNLVYYGVHNRVWEGARIGLPSCALGELSRRLSEAIKRKRRSDAGSLPHVLAYLSMIDMLEAGAPIVPSPQNVCDLAMPRIDPVLLSRVVLATSDDGAYRYWGLVLPPRTLSRVKYTVDNTAKPTPGTPLGLARLTYSAMQLLLAIDLMGVMGIVEERPLIISEGREEHMPGRWLAEKIGV